MRTELYIYLSSDVVDFIVIEYLTISKEQVIEDYNYLLCDMGCILKHMGHKDNLKHLKKFIYYQRQGYSLNLFRLSKFLF